MRNREGLAGVRAVEEVTRRGRANDGEVCNKVTVEVNWTEMFCASIGDNRDT